jgi:hypothetical protein
MRTPVALFAALVVVASASAACSSADADDGAQSADNAYSQYTPPSR